MLKIMWLMAVGLIAVTGVTAVAATAVAATAMMADWLVLMSLKLFFSIQNHNDCRNVFMI